MSYVSPIKIGYAAEPEEGWTDKIGKYLAGEVDNLVLESCVKVGCHVDKDELEKALRYDRDQYVKGYEDGKRDAAAAIEGLVKSVHIRDKHLDELNQYIWKLEAEVKRLEPKRGEMYFLEYDNPETGEFEQTYFQCSVCGKYFYGIDECEAKHFNYCPNCGAKMTEVQDG